MWQLSAGCKGGRCGRSVLGVRVVGSGGCGSSVLGVRVVGGGGCGGSVLGEAICGRVSMKISEATPSLVFALTQCSQVLVQVAASCRLVSDSRRELEVVAGICDV